MFVNSLVLGSLLDNGINFAGYPQKSDLIVEPSIQSIRENKERMKELERQKTEYKENIDFRQNMSNKMQNNLNDFDNLKQLSIYAPNNYAYQIQTIISHLKPYPIEVKELENKKINNLLKRIPFLNLKKKSTVKSSFHKKEA